jgi:hypothetical protein
MFALLSLALLAAAPDRPGGAIFAAAPGPQVPLESPAGAYFLAFADLTTNVPAPVRDRTRYLALYAVPKEDRGRFCQTLAFWCASLSYRRDPPRLAVTGDGLLVRVNLYDCEWDARSREDRRAQLKASGVEFSEGDVSPDPWEALARKDPYFYVSYQGHRGWLDPGVESAVRNMTYSCKAVLRADWFLAQTATDRPDGHYSDFLMLPSKETDLYKSLLLDEKNIRLRSLTVGGATKAGVSFVAQNPRELELLRGPYGDLWRTYDFSRKKVIGDKKGVRNPRRSLRGTSTHDGREIIWELPSGLSGYYAANGDGVQVAEVPTDIAVDQRGAADDGEQVRERTVINAWKCVDCHGRESGYINFQDSVTAQMLHAPNSGLLSVGRDAHAVELEKRRNEDYYLEHYQPRINAERASYTDAIKKCNGLTPDANAKQFVAALTRYSYDPVTRADAAREFGVVDGAMIKPFLKSSGDPDLLFLVDDEPITRAQFETSFAAGMRGVPVYPWENHREKKAEKKGDDKP